MEYKFTKLTKKELLEIFPEVIQEIIPNKIIEWEAEYNELLEHIKNILRKASKKDEWFYEILVEKLFLPDLFECEKQLRILKSYLFHSQTNKYEDFENKLEKAKEYPILSIAETQLELKRSGNNYLGLCPFHNEKTPSFYIYTSGNNYYCFGCGAHGDVISLTQYLYGLGFKEAVQMLQY